MPPDPVSRHPGFAPYGPLRDELIGLPAQARVGRCNELARQRELRSAAGAPIRFSLSEGCAPGALGYEAAILHEGRIECRSEGRGALHDLHNALVWLTFPRIKASLNRLHFASAGTATPHEHGRGRVRDAVTLLDESGLLWLSASRLLDEQLLARDWTRLLVANREQVRTEVVPIVIGHGLLEKLAAPYKSMTAHCLVLPWPAPQAAVADIDAAVARRLADEFDEPVLAPLPILGLPGWDPANIDASYYGDARVFRARKSQ